MDLIIKPTQRCNFACTFCSSTDIAKSNKRSDDLDISKIFEFLKRYPNTQRIIVNGGDPLNMDPNYYHDILDYIKRNNLKTELRLITNLWDWYKNPDKWHSIFKLKHVHVGTSFNLGSTRRITKNQVLTKDIFIDIMRKFYSYYKYYPNFIAVINQSNYKEALDTVKVAKEIGSVCSLNYAVSSGRESICFPIGYMYNIYLDIYEQGLSKFEYNTQQMLKKLRGDDATTCPLNRKCDEGIRNLQPQSNSGYEYGSCGAFGDDQEYGIDFEKEMKGEFFKPLQSAKELSYQKEECLTCPNFSICNGCYKTVRDLKKHNLVEASCREMKKFRQRAIELGLVKK